MDIIHICSMFYIDDPTRSLSGLIGLLLHNVQQTVFQLYLGCEQVQ
jgi:hypothetical protein